MKNKKSNGSRQPSLNLRICDFYTKELWGIIYLSMKKRKKSISVPSPIPVVSESRWRSSPWVHPPSVR